ncbi:hypothetical protein VINI7043_06565 [Vibrio nigripulchritudo ATCC 27043]|uniref:hypothetical protein n=1 Tax=Vibrio nigripulchritudo TaxID=28173 RepID=UPI00021C3466|nr:hypothetical protein [Vibrio nigripulchritudo]EGU60268.1 hypothetical protein VINI7043_06565 [Vibrio nigripulchritudo ATCC 27043]
MNQALNVKKQSGFASIEVLLYVVVLFFIIWMSSDIARYVYMQDRINTAVVVVGNLAADLVPKNDQNRTFESLLCNVNDANKRYDLCPDSLALRGLKKAAREVMGLADDSNFAMRIEYISRPNISQSEEYARSPVLGRGNCKLIQTVPGGIRIHNYLTRNYANSPAEVKNRAHNQYVYVSACYVDLSSNWFTSKLLGVQHFSDSFSIRRYWYQGDTIEN